MPLELAAKDYEEIWASGKGAREDMATRQRYYDGKHAILDRVEFYSDKKQKKNRVVNWVRLIVNRYVGLITSTPYQVTAEDDTDQTDAVFSYTEIADKNDLARVDVCHLRTMLVKGRSVEVHGYVDDEHVIEANDPSEWVFLRDEMGKNIAAIRMITIPSGTFLRGDLLTKDREVMTVYDDARITTYERTKGNTSRAWETIDDREHFFSHVPVIEMRLNENAESIIRDAVIGLNDEFNEIYSTAGDDVRRTVDALLKLTNVDPKWARENATTIQQDRILPLGEGSDAEYIMRQSDTEPTAKHLARTREAIHTEGEVPDVEQIVGATGDTSGIALRLKFMPMIQSASSMVHYIRAGIRDRIDLINDRLRQTGKPEIENYRIVVQFTLPVNRLEEWKSIKSLDGVVSHRTQLELLSDIGDPETELLRIESENAPANPIDAETPEEARAAQEDRLANGADALRTSAGELMTIVASVIRDEALKSGVVDREVKRAIEQPEPLK